MRDGRRFPKGKRVVIHFKFTDAPARERYWWLVVENATTDHWVR